MPGFGELRERAAGIFKPRFENFDMPRSTYEQMDGGGSGGGGGMADDGGGDSPCSLDDYERPPLRHVDKYLKAELPCVKTIRYTMALMTCLGFIISFGMRCNLGMAKLSSTPVEESGNIEHYHHNGSLGTNRTIHGAFFNWTVSMESAIDTSFFYGYLITQVPGGVLASKFPANRLFGTAIVISAFLHLFIPGAILWDPYAVIVIRVLQGFVEGVTYPACHGIMRFWAPPLERSRLATMAFSGSYAGVVIGMPISGMLTGWISWKAAFYFYGVMGLVWYVFWLWLSYEKPRMHPGITIKELKYIEKSLGESNPCPVMPTFKTTPWKAFFTSMPVYAIIVANFCRSWNFYLLVLYQAAYLKQSFNFAIQSAGIVGALPHLLMTVIVPFGGMLADYLRRNNILSTTNVRKLFNCGGFGMEGLFFFIMARSSTAAGAITALTIGVACSGFAISGYNVNHLDIAPRYASILMGLSNGIGTIAGIICPVVIDHITNKQPPECWKTVFNIAATVHLIGCTFYAIFASGELQPWAEPKDEEQKVWTPTTGAGLGTGAYMKETTFTEPSQEQLNGTNGGVGGGGQMGYGATQQHVNNNPFAYAATIAEEQVQPQAQDSYMHGNIEDRTY